jgi:hypothetical protein
VFVAYAVPLLRNEVASIKAGTTATLHRPDFFHKSNRSTPDDLLRVEPVYESRLASYLLISAFSFFEAFVVGILEEVISFHGGEEDFLSRSRRRTRHFMAPHPPVIAALKRKLRGAEAGNLRDKYRKFSRLLSDEGYRFPGELFASFGIKTLVSKVKNLKAYEIPEILSDALQLELTTVETRSLNATRKTRNKIAHGEHINLTMFDTVKMTTDLRKLATKIADHVSENLLVVERYAP